MGLISRVSSRTYRKFVKYRKHAMSSKNQSNNPVSTQTVSDFNQNVELWVEKFEKYQQQVKRVNGYKQMQNNMDKKLMSTIRKEEHICELLKHGRNLLKRGIDQIEKKSKIKYIKKI